MRLQALILALSALPLAGCATPTVMSLDLTSGPPHTLVMIQGTNLGLGTVVWDAGTSAATDIPGGFLGAFMFSVPPTATPGAHNVAVRNSGGQSTIQQFTVVPAVGPFPKPRIDSVTLVGATFDASGHVTAGLYVQGANIDVGAEVLIGGTPVATFAHKGLRNKWFGVAPTEFDYPITHFVSTIAATGTRAASETLSITVRNLDGQINATPFLYQLPANAASIDSDGDGLLDSWENNGYDSNGDGVIDVNLPALGTNAFRRDILVELDVMPAGTATQPGLQHPPDPAALAAARAMFDAAPFLNPMGPPGINLILDASGSIPYYEEICWDISPLSGCDSASMVQLGVKKYSELKAAYFDNAHRDKIFHYAIWGAKLASGDPGVSDGADDIVVSFDEWAPAYQTVRSQVEELTHEVGHDLGLEHGGGTDPFNAHLPNHWSVMSYTWDKRTGHADLWRVQYATCPPFYYGKAGADESASGAPPMDAGTATDYSSGMGKMVVASENPSVPPTKVCGKLVDWWHSDAGSDIADWPRVRFDGPATNGTMLP
jgi:hypothetical protein